MPIIQKNRPVAVSTPLGEDELVLRRMTGHEGMSQLFEYELELFSEDLDIKYENLLGGNATVRVALDNGETRYFNGYISSFSLVGQEGQHCTYRAILKPWLWFLTRTADCRIFQEQTVPDIIKEVFRSHGFTDIKDELTDTYRTWEYCVQYRETDFNFVSRLMEQEGIYYFFTHENGKHELVLADAMSSHQPTEGYSKVPYFPPENTKRRKQDHINLWHIKKEVLPGSCALNDFNFKAPKNGLIAVSNEEQAHEHASYEIYDYPGEYSENSEGERYARKRIDEFQAQYEIVTGGGDVRGLSTGALFNLLDYPRDDQNHEYLLLSAEYEIYSDALEGGAEGDEETFYCSFSAIDSQQQYRASRVTPKPIIQGMQTAIVVGASGEEIYTDEHGRVKLQFHWDRYGKSNESSSCWIRVSQVHAGKGFGGVDIPRIGEEVIVSFEEGDPDRPLIIGRVYNGDNKPPNGLPAAKMVSGLKSNTTPGGGGNNAIMLNDTKGEEDMTIHAQKDSNTTVENDRNTTIVGGNDTLAVEAGTRSVTVKGDTSHTVQAGSRTVSITGGDYSATASDAIILHGKSKGVGITGDAEGVGITGNGKGVGITGNGEGVGITGNAKGVSIVGNGEGVGIKGTPDFFAEGVSEATLKSPVVNIGDAEINITGTKITIAAGGGSIVIDAAGVTIQGSLVKIN